MGDDQCREAQVGAEFEQQGQDLAAYGGVQRGHGLVGDEHLRVQGQRSGDHHALALPAGQLVRVTQEEAVGRSQPGPGQGGGHDVLLVRQAVDARALGDGLVHRVPGVERAGRVLEDELYLPAVRLERLGAVVQDVSVVADLAGGGAFEAEQRAGERGLAAAGLADEGDDLARADGEVHAVHGTGPPASGGELDMQVAGLQQGRARGRDRLVGGLRLGHETSFFALMSSSSSLS